MATIRIEAGKKNKLRAGDILGALTIKGGIEGRMVGKINISLFHAYVAVERKSVKRALDILTKKPVKGRRIKAKIVR